MNEANLNPGLLWALGAGTVAAAGGIGLLLTKLGVWAMFTRISGELALQHPRRKKLYKQIKTSPGSTYRDLLRATGIPNGTARHHLNVLRRSGMIAETQFGATLRFFQNHGIYDKTWQSVVLLREENLQHLHDWLQLNHESRQIKIVNAMRSLGWSPSTTKHRLGRLIEAGLVAISRKGNTKLYTAVDSQLASKAS